MPNDNLLKTHIWDWRNLITLAQTKNFGLITAFSVEKGKFGLWLGYYFMFLLSSIRISLHFENNPNSRDTFYINYGDVLEKNHNLVSYLKQSLSSISRKSIEKYKEITGGMLANPEGDMFNV